MWDSRGVGVTCGDDEPVENRGGVQSHAAHDVVTVVRGTAVAVITVEVAAENRHETRGITRINRPVSTAGRKAAEDADAVCQLKCRRSRSAGRGRPVGAFDDPYLVARARPCQRILKRAVRIRQAAGSRFRTVFVVDVPCRLAPGTCRRPQR